MKLASYTVAGRASWGVVTGDQIADVGAVLSDSHQDLKGWLAAPDQDRVEVEIRGIGRLVNRVEVA
jgi:hypothetical protein